MGKRGMPPQDIKEEEVASPATPPPSYGVSDVGDANAVAAPKGYAPEEDWQDGGDDWSWQQPSSWCKEELWADEWKAVKQESWAKEWDVLHDDWAKVKVEGQGNWHGRGSGGSGDSWNGRGSSRSGSSSSGYYVPGGWVGPDNRFHPTIGFK